MRRKISMTFMAALLPVVAFAVGDWKGRVVDEKGRTTDDLALTHAPTCCISLRK